MQGIPGTPLLHGCQRRTGTAPEGRRPQREGKEESTLNEEPALSKLPFIQAAQVFIPAHEPPNATVSYQLNSRGGGGLRTLNVPNWEGVTNQVQIFWNDFESLNF
jgi:hypothetical protein